MSPTPQSQAPSSNNWAIGILFAIFGTFLFALKSIFIKLAYQEGANADEVLLLRMLIAAPFYLGMLCFLKRRKAGKDRPSLKLLDTTKIIGLGFFGYYLASYLDLKGLHYISAQLERLTLFTYPTMIAILAWLFLGEKITKAIILSLLLCYTGLWIMYGQEIQFSNQSSSTITHGVLLVLGSALSYSIYVILAKPMILRFGSRLFTSIAMLGSTLFVVIHFGIIEGPSAFLLSDIEPIVWLYTSLLAFVCTVIPSFMITEAISRIGAARTSILGTAGPVFTIVLAVIIIDEPFTLYHALGVLIVLIGVGVVSRKK